MLRKYNLSHIKAVIWDVDGPLIPYNPKVHELCDEANSDVVCSLIPGFDRMAAIHLSKQSHILHGNNVTGLLPEAVAYGLDPEIFKRQLHEQYHIRLRELILQHLPDHISRSVELVAAFERLNGKVQHGTATHSSVPKWTQPAFIDRDILGYFNTKAMIGLDSCDEIKRHGVKMLRLAMEALEVMPEETAFVEDTALHLECAKRFFPDLTAVHVVPNPPQQVACVDVTYRNAVDFLNHVAEDHEAAKARLVHDCTQHGLGL